MYPKVESNNNNTVNSKISVIIPVFNTEKYLHRCVDSVLAQSFPNFELILVDDCSTDTSPEVCEEYAKKDRRINVIHNAQNKGSSLTRKIGLDAANGDYILFVDSDDWIEPDMLELMYSKAVSDDLDIVYCGFYKNTDSEQQEFDVLYLDDKLKMIKELAAWKKFQPAVWNKLVKHGILKKIIFPTVSLGEDVQITIQTIHYAKRISYIKNPLYHYYYNETSLYNNASRILQGYIDIYHIESWVINFISDNYSTYFNIFEPELSAYINSLKLHFVQEKPIRDASKLHELYPASNRQIFNTAWKEALYNKAILFLAVNNLVCLAYPLSYFFNILKKVYRLLIPKNIRSSIWEKRNASQET